MLLQCINIIGVHLCYCSFFMLLLGINVIAMYQRYGNVSMLWKCIKCYRKALMLNCSVLLFLQCIVVTAINY